MERSVRSRWLVVLILGRYLLALGIFWILGFAFVQFGQRFLGGWPATEAGQLVACILGVAIALRMRARVVAYLIAAIAAFSASELVIHSAYGIRAAQGAATHFAVMGAGVVGVALGALLTRCGGWAPAEGAVGAHSGSSDVPVVPANERPDAGNFRQRSNLCSRKATLRQPARFEAAVGAARG